MSIRPVRPIAPVAPYIGGKRGLAARLVGYIEHISHDHYAEAFVGMAGVFLRRRSIPPIETINDVSRDVATFFRVLQRHYTAFMEMMRFQLTVRAEFERLVATDPDTLTDLERAARFFYLQRAAFGGKVASRTFGVSAGSPGRFNIVQLGPMLEDLHGRLAGVTIECLDWRDFLARYDTPGTLFYLDPPYWGSENYYGKGLFKRADFTALADRLEAIEGRFILSVNKTPETVRLFERFACETAMTTYSVNDENPKKAEELIVFGPGPAPAAGAWSPPGSLL